MIQVITKCIFSQNRGILVVIFTPILPHISPFASFFLKKIDFFLIFFTLKTKKGEKQGRKGGTFPGETEEMLQVINR